MGYRNIFIESNCKLSIRNASLVVKNSINETLIPLEDINSVIIDNRICSITTYLIDEFSKNDILLYVCNEKHMPTSILLNINSYCRQLKRIEEQITLPKTLQKRLWQNIIIQKIQNQSMCLNLLGIDGCEYLQNLSKSVQSGDATNVEATAAAYYFKCLFGINFTRRSDSIINMALNYGYAIIRGMIARSLVAYGFETSIGIFHHNDLNNFNLADDIIECFRPLVDLYIITVIPEGAEELNSQIKREIFNITNQLVIMDNKKFNVQNAIDYLIMTLSKSYRDRTNSIVLPKLIPLCEYKFI